LQNVSRTAIVRLPAFLELPVEAGPYAQTKEFSIMFDVTDRALDKLETLKNESASQEGQGVTLIVQEDGELGLALAFPQEEDHVVERNGEPVIIVPQPLLEPLDGITLDYVENEEHQGFTLDRQDAAGAS
jgi:Fe-S cluster assembly iron-binding protein IscA